MFVALGKQTSTVTGQTDSGTAIGFGGHLSAGAEARLGPGYLLLEVRAGLSSVSIDNVWNNANLSGLSTVLGYRFVF
jgi:hypothetical protein